MYFEHTQEAKLELLEKSPAFLLLDDGVEQVHSFLADVISMALCPPSYIIVAGSFSHGGDYTSMLNAGVDPCINKPIIAEVVLSVIRAVFRRERRPARFQHGKLLPRIEHKELTIDPLRRTVTMRGELVALTMKEFNILYLLADHAGAVLTKKKFLSLYGTSNTICMGRAILLDIYRRFQSYFLPPAEVKDRQKSTDYIQTVFGVGYRFVD